MARFLFGVLSQEPGPLRISEEIIEGHKAVVLFDTAIGHKAAQGLNVLELNDHGLVSELTVFFRPLESLTLIAEAVGARMAAEFGPPPE